MKELTWGDWLRLWRQARGWSCNELGRRAGIYSTSISDYERGVSYPAPSTLLRLAAALEIDLCDLAPLCLLRTSRRLIRPRGNAGHRPRPAGAAGRRRGGA